MKNIIKILVVTILSCQFAMAQTITKTASNNNPFIGESFYYTITIEKLNSFSDLNFVEDVLGPNVDYLGIELGDALYFTQKLFCQGITSTYSNNTLKVDFSTCNVAIVGIRSFTFKVLVKLNKEACAKPDHSNIAVMNINNNIDIISNDCIVTINKDDPYKLEKVFRKYDFFTGKMTYDIRLNSAYGDFGMLDFSSLPKFTDSFKIPQCLDLGANPTNNIEVVYVPDENTMTQYPVNNYNVAQNGNFLYLGWDLPFTRSTNTSILYQVVIKIEDCACVNQLFSLENNADFKGFDKCGTPIKKSSTSIISDVACINGEPDVPVPGEKELCFSKSYKIDDNDLNLVMKGCTGSYFINVENCSSRIIYDKVSITDLLPTELDYGNIDITTNNATATQVGNNITIQSNNAMNPGDIITIKIPFQVNTNTPDFLIKNCATVNIIGYNSVTNRPWAKTETSCTYIKTVPNTVTLYTNKEICKGPSRKCAPLSIPSNVPGDVVEYTLHFYNYGTAMGDDFVVEDLLPTYFNINNLNTDVRVFKKESRGAELGNICNSLTGFRTIDNTVTKNYNAATNKLTIDFGGNRLDEFTCKGVTHYVVKVKAKIDVAAPNGTYENEFFVNYRDTSISVRDVVVSDKVQSIVNVDNLILAFKDVNKYSPELDCENKTEKYTFKIVLANMGQIPVFADMDDVLGSPSPANLLSYGNFKMCSTIGATNQFCTPTTAGATSNPNAIPTSSTANSFNITGLELKPCEVVVITYEALFDFNLLSKNQVVKVCNELKLRTYVDVKGRRNKSQIQPVVTSNQSLIQHYLDAPTDQERLEVIELIKETKRNPKLLSNNKKNDSKRSNSSRSSRNINFDYGVETLEACLDLKDCLPPKETGCFSDNSSPFEFSILGMNRSGKITTSLINQNPLNKVTQIEYLLTDVRQIKTCEPSPFWWGGRPWFNRCRSCSPNVKGEFSTTNTTSIGLLNYSSQSALIGAYRESNKVEFKGLPTTVTQDNRTFKFPANVNCNGTFEFTITAIVHFEDCSVCYVTDVFDYNASFRFTFPNPQTRIGNLKPFTPFKP
jgi:hypothetical protein